MGRKKKSGLLKNIIMPVRINADEDEFFAAVGKQIHELNPLVKEPNRSEVVMTLVSLGKSVFEAKYGKVAVPKRDKLRKI